MRRAVRDLSVSLCMHGFAGFCPVLPAASMDKTVTALNTLREMVQFPPPKGASVRGVWLEESRVSEQILNSVAVTETGYRQVFELFPRGHEVRYTKKQIVQRFDQGLGLFMEHDIGEGRLSDLTCRSEAWIFVE